MDPGIALVVVATVFTSLAIIVAVVRLIARFWILRASGIDDYCVVGATITSLGMLVSINLGQLSGRRYGIC
jgi:hypothetical protein